MSTKYGGDYHGFIGFINGIMDHVWECIKHCSSDIIISDGNSFRIFPYETYFFLNMVGKSFSQSGLVLIILFGSFFDVPLYTINKDPRNLRKSDLYGPTETISGGFIYGGNVIIGRDKNTNEVSLVGASAGIGATLGISYGRGQTDKKIVDVH